MNKNINSIVDEVRKDYEVRREARKMFDSIWQLNSNFVKGNQYSRIGLDGEVVETDKKYHWQERGVFNHVAPIVDTRLAKLSRVRPTMVVRPSSSDDDNVRISKEGTERLAYAREKLGLNELITKGTEWSEIYGSVFYKVSTRDDGFNLVVEICPPQEIYPDELTCQGVDSCNSIIRARYMNVPEMLKAYGDVAKKLSNKENFVIERYTVPCEKYKNGELVIISDDSLLYHGELPCIAGEKEKRVLPFVEQYSLANVGGFFGTSVVERLIPVQRAYNAIQNRKHEFLNRLTSGVLIAEDGSIDTDRLSPGKVIIYRQGSQPPRLLDQGSTPLDFTREEDRLLSEFLTISGVSGMNYAQDDTRLYITAESIRRALRRIGQMILKFEMPKSFSRVDISNMILM